MPRFVVQGVAIDLEFGGEVFEPSPNGFFYAESVVVHPGERVIDLGTGTGILAIFAAKRGARVCATDTDPGAVRLAAENARANGVQIEVRQGSFFDSFSGTFDVVLANLPNEIVASEHVARIGEARARTVAGGEAGNELILELLRRADERMTPRSRLYLPVHSLTDYRAVLREALSRYRCRLLALAELPAKPFVLDHLEFYRELHARGVIALSYRDGQWFTTAYVFELTLNAP